MKKSNKIHKNSRKITSKEMLSARKREFRGALLLAGFFALVFFLTFGIFNYAFKSLSPIPEKKTEIQEKNVKAAVVVNAFVASRVSEVYSKMELVGSGEILADGQQAAVILVTLKDKETLVPLPDIPIVPSSNRGDIDKIDPKTANSNASGQATFTVKSEVAGQSTISGVADGYIGLNDKVVIKWLPLPLPTAVKVSIKLPNFLELFFGIEKLTIINGPETGAPALVNPGREFFLPFWIILVPLTLISVIIILSSYLLNLSRRLKKYEKTEGKLLEKENEMIAREEQLIEEVEKLEKGKQEK